jgi:NAD(P)-dependent dehydrogenase (short-subunit alcohol dehydrogenase family)
MMSPLPSWSTHVIDAASRQANAVVITARAYACVLPRGPAGAPVGIAEAVVFLASDAAGCITGDLLVVCGGIGVHARP